MVTRKSSTSGCMGRSRYFRLHGTGPFTVCPPSFPLPSPSLLQPASQVEEWAVMKELRRKRKREQDGNWRSWRSFCFIFLWPSTHTFNKTFVRRLLSFSWVVLWVCWYKKKYIYMVGYSLCAMNTKKSYENKIHLRFGLWKLLIWGGSIWATYEAIALGSISVGLQSSPYFCWRGSYVRGFMTCPRSSKGKADFAGGQRYCSPSASAAVTRNKWESRWWKSWFD